MVLTGISATPLGYRGRASSVWLSRLWDAGGVPITGFFADAGPGRFKVAVAPFPSPKGSVPLGLSAGATRILSTTRIP